MNETVPSSAEESPLAKNLKSKSIWMRLLFMLVMTFLYSVSRIVVGVVVAVQFFWVLLQAKLIKNYKNLVNHLPRILIR